MTIRLLLEEIGFYLITNKKNGKKYVGQSWDIDKRLKQHMKYKSNNPHLTNSLNKYGEENFTYERIGPKLKDDYPELLTQKWLDRLEDRFIKGYNTLNSDFGYNKKEGGNGGKHSEEVKNNYRKAVKNNPYLNNKESIEDIKNNIINRNISFINYDIDALAKRLRWSKQYTKDIKNLIFAIKYVKKSMDIKKRLKQYWNKPENKKKIKCIETGVIYNSAVEVNQKTGIDNGNISRCISGKLKTAGGFHWKYVESKDNIEDKQ